MSGKAKTDFQESIKEANLSMLLLMQTMLREDKEMGMFRLGLSSEVAEIIVNLSIQQSIALSMCGQLLTRFRFDDHKILAALTNKVAAHQRGTAAAHAAVLLAAQPAEAIS